MPNNHFKTKMGYFGCKIEFWRIYKVICRDIENRLGTPPLKMILWYFSSKFVKNNFPNFSRFRGIPDREKKIGAVSQYFLIGPVANER